MHVTLIGGTGLLGGTLALSALERGHSVTLVSRQPAESGHGANHVACDVLEQGALNRLGGVLEASELVINLAALTSVDGCETPGSSEQLNVAWPATLAQRCGTLSARLIHISTDSVFDLDGEEAPALENRTPNPKNEYARQKVRSEEAVLTANPSALVVRTNFFGWNAIEGAGLAEWILSSLRADQPITGFTDVEFAPLYTRDLAKALLELGGRGVAGRLHLGSTGCISKWSFAQALATAAGIQRPRISQGTLAEASLKAPRPKRTCLDSSRAEKELGRRLPTVEQGIRKMIDDENVWRPRLLQLRTAPRE